MKRYLYIIAAMALVLACGKPENPGDKGTTVSISTFPSTLTFSSDGSETPTLTVKASGAWTASKSHAWITVTPDSGTGNTSVSVTAGFNTGEAREGAITFWDKDRTISAEVKVKQDGYTASAESGVVPQPAAFDGTKRASTTYQLLIYSFADSNGDGIGDFNGIRSKLDYLDGLGVTALWLSPAHPSDSYHAYDVTDYYSVNPLYGTEQDFKSLIDAAHAKGIKIYMDYVLNHSGKGNPWFKEALSNASSKYRDYYFISANPSSDYSKFPMLTGTSYQSGEWKQATSGSPRLTVTKTEEAVTSGSSDWNLWFWQGESSQAIRFKDKGDGTYYLVMDINGGCGMLVRKWMNWDNGSKFGASGNGTLSEGTAMDLVGDGGDISFTGSGRYRIELSNVSTQTLYYMGCFSDWMPDLNYGDVSVCENNATFQDLAASADKWINMGIDGLRLDAVKHICGGIDSYNHASNRTLLQKWYEHCNATYKAAGHSDNIFMVAEEWDSHNTEKEYYKSLTSCFEFEYFDLLTKAVSGNAGNYVTTVNRYLSEHTAQRADAITSLFMTNHDQNRAAESLGRNAAKEKQAAAMLLTTPGKPFIYQGEELGYYGKKDGGDEYVRTPVLWDKAGKDCAKKGVNNKVDNAMLTSSISVEAQSDDGNSLLNVYKTWSRLRNTYPALAEGTMTAASMNSGNVAAWYMTATDGSKLLVIHHTGTTNKVLSVSDDMSRPVALLGTASVSGKTLKLGANSSVVFQL